MLILRKTFQLVLEVVWTAQTHSHLTIPTFRKAPSQNRGQNTRANHLPKEKKNGMLLENITHFMYVWLNPQNKLILIIFFYVNSFKSRNTIVLQRLK